MVTRFFFFVLGQGRTAKLAMFAQKVGKLGKRLDALGLGEPLFVKFERLTILSDIAFSLFHTFVFPAHSPCAD